ncbi:hypothetical protein GCM10011507_34930 [Edaphobacter acidisoli]|uniref:Uncharacterized protein n=1 Tax=Edaphobacter acidisoli TaxID=2040573 RepID=A0A916WAJ1_9BACT|nr:hypothetical protein [Edaphobacter acidisoli]GGA80726.1 hypothetical protein GCM10011507_34930 [Edaphobacter acidisoli]
MRIRLKIGRRAGEVVEVSPEAARAMLADGRAVDIRAEIGAMPIETATPEVALPRAAEPITRRRRR